MIVLARKLSPFTEDFLRVGCLNSGDQRASFAQWAGAFADVNERVCLSACMCVRMGLLFPPLFPLCRQQVAAWLSWEGFWDGSYFFLQGSQAHLPGRYTITAGAPSVLP